MSSNSTAGAFSGHRLGETFDRIAPGASHLVGYARLHGPHQPRQPGLEESGRISIEATSCRGVRLLLLLLLPTLRRDERTHIAAAGAVLPISVCSEMQPSPQVQFAPQPTLE
jgi:hypothetical protein